MFEPVPLSLEHLKQRLAPPAPTNSAHSTFFAAFADCVGSELQLRNKVAVKCSVLRERKPQIEKKEEQAQTSFFQSGAHTLQASIETDAAFDQLLCEISLGGTGVPEPEGEGFRPPSRFERALKCTVLKTLLSLMPAAALKSNAIILEPRHLDDDEARAAGKKTNAQPALELIIQVNAFALSATVSVRFIEQELSELFASATPVETNGPVARDVLGECKFQFDAFFKPRSMPLSEVLAMKIGHVVSLGVGLSDALTLCCEGKPVVSATIKLQGDKVGLTLRPFFADGRVQADLHTATNG